MPLAFTQEDFLVNVSVDGDDSDDEADDRVAFQSVCYWRHQSVLCKERQSYCNGFFYQQFLKE